MFEQGETITDRLHVEARSKQVGITLTFETPGFSVCLSFKQH